MSGNGNAVLRDKKKYRFLRIAAVIAVVILIAAGITAAWQKAENERILEGKESSSKFAEAVFNFVNLLDDLMDGEKESASVPETASSQPEESVSESGEEPSSGSQEEVSELPAWGLLEESEPKEVSYFEDAVILGDSMASGAQESRFFSGASFLASIAVNADSILNKDVINSGGEGYTIPEALAAKEDVGKIYILMGADSISWMDNPTYIKKFSAFLDAVTAAKPGCDLYLVSILPVNESLCAEHGDDILNADIDAINEKFLALAEERGFWYVNAAEAFKDEEGGLSEDATSDGITLKSQQYEALQTYLLSHTAH
ncbi:MAG TPA: GDSL-type esterase/lipase family protein [Oscillospiraceae bacterium]|nr:GDSL-type esterase/lipase family protein [Oscillospiraceae bacterium]